MKKVFICFFVLVTMLTASTFAETLRFRSGEILCAELSEKISGFDGVEKNAVNLPEKKIYAALTVSLDRGRKMSIYDYSLNIFGTTVRPVAIRSGNDDINPEEYETSGSGKDHRCTIYFILDRRYAGIDDKEKIELVCNVPPVSEQNVIFTNRRSRGFTPVNRIPASGIMNNGK